ncbi:ferritin-like domain-containing protein [Aliinostoc sp. HNIBRCY26]|uniref:ferritin-like domain-containing protein n=1 Tax=Aliinostoc sp. HNIBRCY26 TaxID=3418997 RepID=UPI003CFF78BF
MINTTLKYQVAGLDLPHIDSDNRLRRILTATLPNQSENSAHPQDNYWDREFFNLHQVQIFQQASESEQLAILQILNQGLLTESYFIEKAGVGYMAKMVMLAETVEERMLYAMFTADEATHLKQISHFLPENQQNHYQNPFLQLLAEVVESADKTVLLFVLQVVLEGWGLSHYRRLAKSCQHPALAELFTSFLDAESRHHSTGSTLFSQTPLTTHSQTTILEILTKFLLMVQIGPQSILSAIAQIKGHLSRSQKIHILEQVDTQTHSNTRLQILRSLMQKTTADVIVQTLETQGSFTPLPPHQCV